MESTLARKPFVNTEVSMKQTPKSCGSIIMSAILAASGERLCGLTGTGRPVVHAHNDLAAR